MADENNITTLAKRLRPFIKMAAQEMVPVTPYDHGNLSGLADDDHLQYVHKTQARTITAVHTFDPTSATAPFIIAPDGQGQTVVGLKADQLNKAITAGNGLTGGGNLDADVTLNVGGGSGISVGVDGIAISLATPSGLAFDSGNLALDNNIAGSGLTINSKVLAINLASPSGLVITTDQLQLADGVAGAGLSISSKVLSVGQGSGLTVGTDEVSLTTPGTLSYISTNNAEENHTHQISHSSNPGAAASLLSTDASGVLTLVTLKTEVLQDRGISGSILINPAGDISLDPGGNDVLPVTNYEINLGAINKKYLTLHAAELWVETLVAADVMATIGGRILVAPTTVLVADLGIANTTIHVKHNQMAVGDRIYLESNGNIEWMAITAGPIGSAGDYSYDVTRNLDGSGANQWYAGDAILNTGTTGDGYIDIYSVDSIRSGVHYGPTIVGNIRTGTTYSNLIEGWAIGNLNGLYGYGADTYGAAFGKYINSSSFLTIDPTNGIRMLWKNGLGANLVLAKWDISGNLIIGQEAASQNNIYISSGAISIRNNTTDRIEMSSAGVLTINNSAGSAVFTFDSSSGAEFTLPLTLATGGGIYQGTGTFASPTTGLKIYNSGGIGMIAGYSSGVVQWYGNTDGKLYAGAGSVWLDAGGLNLARSASGSGYIRWIYSGSQRGDIWMNNSGAGMSSWNDAGTLHSQLWFDHVNYTFGIDVDNVGMVFSLDASPGDPCYADFSWCGVRVEHGVRIGTCFSGVTYQDDLNVDGGIWVGRAADATAGNIGYTGALLSYKNSTSYTGYIFVPLTAGLTSTSFDGDSFPTTAKTEINLSTSFGAPAGIKAILVKVSARDSGSYGADCYLIVSPNNTAGSGFDVRPWGRVNDTWETETLICPCNANGNIYYQVLATGGATATLESYISIWGYWI